MNRLGQAPQQQELKKDFFIYSAYTSSVAAAATFTDTINIDADSVFLLQKLTMFADIAGAVETESSRVLPLVTVQITDTGSGRQLFDDELPVAALFGDGKTPFILPNPRRFSSNTALVISGTNYSAATTYANLYLLLIGYKIYYARG